jgi:ligand-binding sensor domain-containing protein
MDIWPDPVGERRDAAHGDWLSREPDWLNPSHWVLDNVTGIAVLNNGDAWIGSFSNGLRIVDHDGQFRADATAVLRNTAVGALAKDPADESIWIGYRNGSGVTRIKQDGTVMHYGAAALGELAYSAVWDIQVQPATATSKRRILVAFRSGVVGIYDGR